MVDGWVGGVGSVWDAHVLLLPSLLWANDRVGVELAWKRECGVRRWAWV